MIICDLVLRNFKLTESRNCSESNFLYLSLKFTFCILLHYLYHSLYMLGMLESLCTFP
jgi:hypothetical protein